jgi:hypothetical protein
MFVFMALRSNLLSFELYGESLLVERGIASEFGFAASQGTMMNCSLDLEVAFYIILQSLEFTQDRLYRSCFLNNLCSTCLASSSSSRVTEIAINITSRLKSADVCVVRITEVLRILHGDDSEYTEKFISRCRMGVLLSCCTCSGLDIAGQIWIARSIEGRKYLMQHLKHHLNSLLKCGNPIPKEFMKILSFCPDTSELITFVLEFQCSPIFALQSMGHLLRMQPEQKQLSEKNVEDLISYLGRWNDFLNYSKKSTLELDKIWRFWIDLWLSLSIHTSIKTTLQNRSNCIRDLFNLIDKSACSRLLRSLTDMHMHTSNQNQIVINASSMICKNWLEQRHKISGIRKSLIEMFMRNPERFKEQFCGFYFEALIQ